MANAAFTTYESMAHHRFAPEGMCVRTVTQHNGTKSVDYVVLINDEVIAASRSQGDLYAQLEALGRK